jgi:hypothetical protein
VSDARRELSRAIRLLDGAPDVTGLPCDVITREEVGEYIRRYHLKQGHGPQERFHHILESDPADVMHNHPWDYTTRLLSGAGYTEHTPDGDVMYGPGDVLTRRAESLHRLELIDGPVWTYFVTGRWRRSWGFLTGHGWVHNRAYHEAGRAAGCDDGHGRRDRGRAWL